MNEKLLGNHYEITSAPVDFTDAVDEWVCELPLEEQYYVNEDEISLRDIVRGLRQNTPEGIMFAATSFEASAFLLRTKNKEKDIMIQQVWDSSIERFSTAAYLLRQRKNPALKKPHPNS